MAAFLVAAKAIREAGYPLKGDLIVSAVAGEISREPIDEWQGPAYLSKDLGARFMVTHGAVADFAIVAEGTGFGIVGIEPGKAHFKVTVLTDRPALLHALPASTDRPRRRPERDRPGRRRDRRLRGVGVRVPATAHVSRPERHDRPEGEHQRDPLRLSLQPDERAPGLLVLRRHPHPAGRQPARPPRGAATGACHGRRRRHGRALPVPAGLRGGGRGAPDRDGPAGARPGLRHAARDRRRAR